MREQTLIDYLHTMRCGREWPKTQMLCSDCNGWAATVEAAPPDGNTRALRLEKCQTCNGYGLVERDPASWDLADAMIAKHSDAAFRLIAAVQEMLENGISGGRLLNACDETQWLVSDSTIKQLREIVAEIDHIVGHDAPEAAEASP